MGCMSKHWCDVPLHEEVLVQGLLASGADTQIRPLPPTRRFEEDGGEYVSPRLKTLLRGLPTPKGKHIFFSDEEVGEGEA